MLNCELIGSVRKVVRGESGCDNNRVAFRRQVHEELRRDLGVVWGEVFGEFVFGIDVRCRSQTEVGYQRTGCICGWIKLRLADIYIPAATTTTGSYLCPRLDISAPRSTPPAYVETSQEPAHLAAGLGSGLTGQVLTLQGSRSVAVGAAALSRMLVGTWRGVVFARWSWGAR